jgi:hypothetical protein
MTLRRFAALLLTTAALASCSKGAAQTAPSPTATPTPVPTRIVAPVIRLVPASLLDLRYLRPVGWAGQPVRSSSAAAHISYIAPGRRGTLYVEQSDCAACVDAGLVMHGRRNGVADPFFALRSYFPTTQHRVDNFHVTFTTAATKPYVGSGKLVVTKSKGGLTGYYIVIVTLPRDEAATTARILASAHIT